MKLINWAIGITILGITIFGILKIADIIPTELTTKYELIILSGDTFDMDVNVLITDDTAFAAKYVRENLDNTVTGVDFDCRGITFPIRDGKPPIVWLPYKSPVAIINHELFHATVEVMNWASVPLNITTEEVYAYELQHLSQQLDNQININK
tara:strand:+ start:215 stop:670 length:456 start_codon:yes stop_codon:yes gene_type:complete